MSKITLMEKSDINEVIDLWHENHLNYCDEKTLPKFLPGGKKTIENYFIRRIDNGNAVILKDKNTILGYFSWIPFNFHNEKSAFCPIIGHLGIKDSQETIYTQLYNYVSTIWIKNDIFNHLWMINNKDDFLKKFSYDLGFGSYVIDAYIKNFNIGEINCPYNISRANKNDCEVLYELIEESRNYYLSAPIFLKRKITTMDEIQNIIENDTVFLAWDNNVLIGFMHVWKKNDYDIEMLTTPESASLGAYIKFEYRSKGIGKAILHHVLQHCIDNKINYLHVSFETANPYGNKFWRKYFDPISLSVRRTVNKDANL
jgi:GNAT superfamily N-acetyltransferase